MITRVSYSDVARITDVNIDKSKEYTITDEPALAMAVILPLHYKMNLSATQNNLIDYVICVIPSNVALDSIKSLDDVEHLGRKIVASAGQGLGPIVLRPTQVPQQTVPENQQTK